MAQIVRVVMGTLDQVVLVIARGLVGLDLEMTMSTTTNSDLIEM